tara:strand:+ start:10331 stop:11272 length:942 start_codon:yes stop_codon:yes gene_type:complete
MKKILIIGASGFVGTNLTKYMLSKSKYQITTVSRYSKNTFNKEPLKNHIIKDLTKIKNWKKIISGHDIVILSFGIAHKNFVSLDKYEKINVRVTEKIVKECLKNKVKKIIFISSVSVFGENKSGLKYFSENSNCQPVSAYGKSKLIAEKKIIKLCRGKIKYFILRPPMIYGFPLRGNLKNLIHLINYKVPMPFKSVNSKRSYIYIKNLLYFIYLCTLERSIQGIYLISDDNDVSINKFINEVCKVQRIYNVQFSMHPSVFNLMFYIPLLSKFVKKTTTPFRLNISMAKKKMKYKPIYNFKNAIKDMYGENYTA